MHIEPIPRWAILGSATAAILVANLLGGRHVRIAAVVITLHVVIDFANIHPPIRGLPMTAIGFAICLAVALRSRRYWAIWAAAAELLNVITDFLRFITPLDAWAYQSSVRVWAFVLMGAVVYGALTDRDASRASP